MINNTCAKLKKIFIKYKFVILYIIFGGITTIINIVLYWLCFDVLGWANVASTIIAWIGAVIFAFFSNKLWVFESKTWNKKTVINEFSKFIIARLATGGCDILFMFTTVDLLNFNGLLMKIIANLFVMVSNYILSKLIVFRKKEVAN